VAQPAVFNSNFNVLNPQRADVNGFQNQPLFGSLGDPCLITPGNSRLALLCGGGGLIVYFG
jgi:hypothetical protein